MGPLGWIKGQSPQAWWDSRGRFSLQGTRRSGFNSWNYEKFKCTGRCWGRGGGCPMVGGGGEWDYFCKKSEPPASRRRRAGGGGGEAKSIRRVLNL